MTALRRVKMWTEFGRWHEGLIHVVDKDVWIERHRALLWFAGWATYRVPGFKWAVWREMNTVSKNIRDEYKADYYDRRELVRLEVELHNKRPLGQPKRYEDPKRVESRNRANPGEEQEVVKPLTGILLDSYEIRQSLWSDLESRLAVRPTTYQLGPDAVSSEDNAANIDGLLASFDPNEEESEVFSKLAEELFLNNDNALGLLTNIERGAIYTALDAVDATNMFDTVQVWQNRDRKKELCGQSPPLPPPKEELLPVWMDEDKEEPAPEYEDPERLLERVPVELQKACWYSLISWRTLTKMKLIGMYSQYATRVFELARNIRYGILVSLHLKKAEASRKGLCRRCAEMLGLIDQERTWPPPAEDQRLRKVSW